MGLYLMVRLIHVVAMLLTVLLMMAAEPVFLAAARAANVEQMERRYRLAQRLLRVTQLTMLIGLLAGVALVVLGGWSPLAPWLVAAYGLLVLMSIVGRVSTSWQQQVQSALQAGVGGVAQADLRAILTDRRAILARWAVIAIFLTIIAVMRTKLSFGLY